MKSVVITGSESFGKYVMNPTKWLALSVDGKVLSGYEIHSLVFPSIVQIPEGSENPGETIVRKAQEVNADAIISFGMSSGINGVRLESAGFNWAFNEKYLSATENNHPLDTSRPEKENLVTDLSAWDMKKMENAFADAGIPFESAISEDAGRYSCNSWIYRTLLYMKEKDVSVPYLFVHVACIKESLEFVSVSDQANKVVLGKNDLVKALAIILSSLKKGDGMI